MWRKIISGTARRPNPPQRLITLPQKLSFPLSSEIHRTELVPLHSKKVTVKAGDIIAAGDHLTLHAPYSGVLTQHNETLGLSCSHAKKRSPFQQLTPPSSETLPSFARAIGLVGMGGSMFPASIKLKASQNIHTLVLNVVECEPGIEIDEALLLSQEERVLAGIQSLRECLPIKKVVLATKKSALPHLKEIATKHNWDLLSMSNTYPAGAEKLIIAKLSGSMPSASTLPFHRGYMVMSITSLWSLGGAIMNNSPVIERPLTLLLPDRNPINLIVPIGIRIADILEEFAFTVDTSKEVIVAGGPMMGKAVSPHDSILKGTNALIIVPLSQRLKHEEAPCILCSSCFDVCPLGLHPIEMAKRVKKEIPSKALTTQLTECFLCGACSAVCPSDIPLVQTFQKGKLWLREQS